MGEGIIDWGVISAEEAFSREMRFCRSAVPETQEPVIALWRSARSVVVLGKGCNVEEEVFLDRAAADGVPVMVRPSGGGTVFLPGVNGPGKVLCVSRISPMEGSDLKAYPIKKVFRDSLGFLLRALGKLGVIAEFAGVSDIAAGGEKLAGCAQARKKAAVLVHASILVEAPFKEIEKYIRQPCREPDYRRGRSHRDFITDLTTITGLTAESAGKMLVREIFSECNACALVEKH